MKEVYKPTPDEIKKAEGIMDDKEKSLSEEREKEWLQTYERGMEYDTARFRSAIEKTYPVKDYKIKEGIATPGALSVCKITPEEGGNYLAAEIYTNPGGRWIASVVDSGHEIVGTEEDWRNPGWGGRPIRIAY